MSLIVDLIILGLLVGTLGYAYIVDRRVQKLMRALHDLEPLIGDFSNAVDRSESAVSRLKSFGGSLGAGLGRAPAARAPEPERERPAPRRAAPAPEPSRYADDDDAAFHSARRRPRAAEGIPVKSDLVRGFFETVKSREA